MIEQINATGYGLTLGVQSRIDETIAQVVAGAHVGNVYVNRNMVGAVVGVQPFGGEGLSGTGPKAGGPLYLYRLLARRAGRRDGARAAPPTASTSRRRSTAATPLRDLQRWARGEGRAALATALRPLRKPRRGSASRRSSPGRPASATSTRCSRATPSSASRADERDRLVQLAAVLAVGSRALWPSDAAPLRARLPEPVRARIDLVDDWTRADGALRRRPPSRQRRRAASTSPPRWRRAPDRSSASTDCARARPRSRSSASSSSARSASTPRPRAATRR